MCYNGTFRFKKLDDSFWNGETFRFADYKLTKFLNFVSNNSSYKIHKF